MSHSKRLKGLLPDFTCPDIDPVLDYLRAQGEDELHAHLCRVKISNVGLRSVATDAVKRLKQWETMARNYTFQEGQECPWCLHKEGELPHSRNCPFKKPQAVGEQLSLLAPDDV